MAGVVLLVLGLAAAACSSGTTPVNSSAPLDHLPVAQTFHSYHVPGRIGLMTSITAIGNTQYAVSDSANVSRIVRDAAGYAVTVLTNPGVPRWNPVGLAYAGGLLYIANGSGRDVVVARVGNSALTVVRRVTNSEMRNAEAVAPAGGDGSIAVVDESSGAVLLFDPTGRLRWRVVVPGAHGLAAAGGRLYVSSLADGRIRALEQSNGSVVRIAGGLGVSKGRYLWPVGLTADGGRVLVTDAHNGAITVLNGDLQVQSRVGANGPGLDAFNYPFATLPVSGGYLIVDSFRYRLARTDRSWTLQDQLALGTAVPVGRQRPTVIGSDAQPNTYRMLPGVDLPAELGLRKRLAFVGGLNGLDHVTANGTVQHVDVVDPQFGSTSITWAQTVESYIVIGSCQGSTLEVIDPATGMFTFVTVGGDTWWRAGELLLSVNLRRTLSAAIAPAVTAFAQAKLLLARGVSRADAFNQALSAGRPRDWSRDLSSPAAQQFLHSAQTPDDAATFFAAALQQREPRAVELLEVKYLSGGQ